MDKKLLLHLLSSEGYIQVNKQLIRKLGLEAAVLIGEFCSQYLRYQQQGKLIDDSFYELQEKIEYNTGLNAHYQRKAIKALTDANILSVVKKGLPAKNYYCINFEELSNQLLIQCIASDEAREGLEVEHVEDIYNNTNSNNKNNNFTLSKDSVPHQSQFDFGKPKKEVKTNNSEYDKAIDLVKTRYNNPKLVSVLIDYITGKKEQCAKLHYSFSAITIKNYLDNLDIELMNDNQKIEAVKLSIQYNFTSKVMKPFSNNNSVRENIEKISDSSVYANEDRTSSGKEF